MAVIFLNHFPLKLIFRVDLTERTFKTEEIPEDVTKRFIGGKGLAAYYSYRGARERRAASLA